MLPSGWQLYVLAIEFALMACGAGWMLGSVLWDITNKEEKK